MTRVSGLSLALCVAAACGGPQKLAGAGATCFRDDDCQPGMICVAPTADDTNRVCSTDPTPLVSMVEGPPPLVTAGAGGMATGGTATAGATGAGTDTGGTPAAGNPSTGGQGAAGSAMGGSSGAGGSQPAAGSGGSSGSAPEGGAPP